MVKKLVSVGLTAVLAATLWGQVSNSSRRVLAKIHRLEATYRYGLSLGDIEVKK